MKNLFLILILFVSSSFAFAHRGEVETLRSELQALKYENEADRNSGANKLEKVIELLTKFQVGKKKSQAKAEFADLVKLVAAGLPFDMETESAGMIEREIDGSASLRKVYEDTLATIEDSCRKQFLQSVIIERSCLRKEERIERRQKRDFDATSCVPKPVFRYSSCIGMKDVEE